VYYWKDGVGNYNKLPLEKYDDIAQKLGYSSWEAVKQDSRFQDFFMGKMNIFMFDMINGDPNSPTAQPIKQPTTQSSTSVNESEITYTDENGKPCATAGLKGSKFKKGGKWEVIKEFKGKSHAQGGIDIEIGKGGIKMSNKQGKFEAKFGLVIPKNN
jgi:hypothetical protein